MMYKRHLLVFEHDIIKYPPILSLITYLFENEKEVIFIGYCSDDDYLSNFLKKGGIYYNVIENDVNDSSLKKIFNYFLFKKKVKNILDKIETNQTKLWLLGEKCSWLIHDLVFSFKTNIYLFEVPSFSVFLRYRLLSPSLDYKKLLANADTVICCEYNRAHITRSFFDLDKLPTVIPNKPKVVEADITLDNKLEEVIQKIKNKKVILYQGIFNYPERKLDCFCEAIDYLPEDFILCLMGTENDYKKRLKEKYISDKIVFIDYVPAPTHLVITKMSYIGVLVYNSNGPNINNILNTLYCAPNKIFEYSKYNIPMISNDVPALSQIYREYNSGIVYNNNSGKEIANIILEIHNNYEKYKEGSKSLYDSVDLDYIYSKIV